VRALHLFVVVVEFVVDGSGQVGDSRWEMSAVGMLMQSITHTTVPSCSLSSS